MCKKTGIYPCYHFSSSFSREKNLRGCQPTPSRYNRRTCCSLTAELFPDIVVTFCFLPLGALLGSHVPHCRVFSLSACRACCLKPRRDNGRFSVKNFHGYSLRHCVSTFSDVIRVAQNKGVVNCYSYSIHCQFCSAQTYRSSPRVPRRNPSPL